MKRFSEYIFKFVAIPLAILFAIWLLTQRYPEYKPLIYAIVLVFAGYIISNWSERIPQKFKRYLSKETMTYLWTLIATILGVYIAFGYSDIDAREKKKENAINWLTITDNDIEGRIEVVNLWLNDCDHNKLRIKDWSENVLEFPMYVLKNQEVVPSISPGNFAELSMISDGLNGISKTMCKFPDTGWGKFAFVYYLNKLKTQATKADQVVKDEIEYIKGEISKDTLESRLKARIQNNEKYVSSDQYSPFYDSTKSIH